MWVRAHLIVAQHRQNLNDVFVAVSTVFLTGLGVLLVMTNLKSWWLVAGVGVITFTITPMNLTWRTALERYRLQTRTHVNYLSAIENEFRQRREAIEGEPPQGELPIGYFLYNYSLRRPHAGNIRIEKRLATYFLGLYPAIMLLVATLTYLGILPLTLKP